MLSLSLQSAQFLINMTKQSIFTQMNTKAYLFLPPTSATLKVASKLVCEFAKIIQLRQKCPWILFYKGKLLF